MTKLAQVGEQISLFKGIQQPVMLLHRLVTDHWLLLWTRRFLELNSIRSLEMTDMAKNGENNQVKSNWQIRILAKISGLVCQNPSG